MKTIRVWATTACRSDFDLLTPVYHALAADDRFSFELLVSGVHLSDRFGQTANHVRATGLPIRAELDTFDDSPSRGARPRTAARWIELASPILEVNPLDLLIACGDREDAIATCMLGAYLRIPVAHFFGGDHGDTRDVDNLVRHASSKLASLHFVMMQEHKARLIAMGEPPDRIHVVGNPALDSFRTTPSLSRAETLRAVDASSIGEHPYAVVVHHPTFSDPARGAAEIRLILDQLESAGIPAVVGLPNADAGSRDIINFINTHSSNGMVFPYQGLGRSEFVNLLRHAELLVGNSSMGLLEAPSIPLAVVNVGSRQRGRTAARNVLFVDAREDELGHAIAKARSAPFRESLAGLVNPYGDGQTAARVLEILSRGIDPFFTDKPFDPLKSQR